MNMKAEIRTELRELKKQLKSENRTHLQIVKECRRASAEACREQMKESRRFERATQKLNRRIAILQGRMS
jgi:hypothetical protein